MKKEAAYIVENRWNNLQKKIKKKILIIIRLEQFYGHLKVSNKKESWMRFLYHWKEFILVYSWSNHLI